MKKTPTRVLERDIQRIARIDAILPAATLAQRLAAMSISELMIAARALARKTDESSERACTAVLEEIEKRAPGAAFDRFVADIYA